MLSQLDQYPTAPGISTEDYSLEIGERAPMTALNADVDFVSSIMVQRVIYSLTNEESLSGSPPILLFSLRKEWIFKRPYEMIHITARKDDWNCSQCWKRFDSDKPLDETNRKNYEKIMQSIQKA
jgi:hypothetical protein